MTALMVLFLVVMSATLLRVTSTLKNKDTEQERTNKDIETVMREFEAVATKFPGVKIFRDRSVIDFGDKARFALNSSTLATEQGVVLRSFLPEILDRANSEAGRRVIKRVVVEGFTDKSGTYLGNLNLSLERSQRVLCSMFEPPTANEQSLTPDQQGQVRALFVVGGYSWNSAKKTDEESRRVEMRIEFYGAAEARLPRDASAISALGTCALR
jgi:flagellar motor protein MotB